MHSYHSNGTADSEPLSLLPDQRSEEVQDILGQMPGWTIRWGITVLAAIVGMILLACWLVSYPDIVSARVILTTRIPPASLIAREEGRLTLLVKDNQAVRKGAHLAVLENPARTEDIDYLSAQVALFKNYLPSKEPDLSQVALRENLRLGELQSPYATFLTSLADYNRFHSLLSHDKQLAALRLRIGQYRQLNGQLEKQQQLLAEELQLAQKRFGIDKQLFGEKVLAEADFDRSKSAWLQARRTFESARDNIISNQIMISQLQMQVTEATIDQAENEARLKNTLETAYKNLESQLHAWQQRYLLQTPITGRVVFTKYRSTNQFIRAGEEVMTVIPGSSDIYGQIQMPVAGSGKVEVGQRVNIRFDNYPSPEYGIVTGKIQAIAPVPRDGLYTIQILLPHGLETSYHKKLAFKQEMQGNAEIITKDLRLIERIFNQLRALMDNATT